MCFASAPSMPALPAPAPQQAQVSQAGADEERKRKQAAAASNTLLTGPQGASAPKLSNKTLLGG